MDASRRGTPNGGWNARAQRLLLDALETAMSWGRAPPDALHVLCRMAARAVEAPVAGHVLHDPATRHTRLTVWRAGAPGVGEVTVEQDDEPPGRDWWTTSRSRRSLLAALDQAHLAELPLTTRPDGPSLVVVGRALPFTEVDGDELAGARHALCLVEQLLARLDLPTREPPPAPDGVPELTGRELEVLQMLAEGCLARSIAQRLEVSERTVHKHLGNLYRKLDAHDRLLAVRRAERLGLVALGAAATGPLEPALAARW